MLHTEGNTLIVVVYVDDLVINGNYFDITFRLKCQLANIFEMANLGFLHFSLGLQVLPLPEIFFISQSKLVMDLLHYFQMDDCKACSTPYQSGVQLTKYCESPQVDTTLYQWLVRSQIYLTHSRPNISFVVSVVSCFM